jgi:hypothetical protein
MSDRVDRGQDGRAAYAVPGADPRDPRTRRAQPAVALDQPVPAAKAQQDARFSVDPTAVELPRRPRIPSMNVDARTGSDRRVGVPIQERLLTNALLANVDSVLRPGVGRSVFAIQEAELGAGRPDVILLSVSVGAVEAFRRTGLRLPSQLAARALDPALSEEDIGVTRAHLRSVQRDLRERGWSGAIVERSASVVHDSLAVEAKVKDWRQAVRQVSRFRRLFHRSAVLMPSRPRSEASQLALDVYGCGLLLEHESTVRWERGSVRSEPQQWARIWLLELLVRGLDDGSAYRPTACRNTGRASR